MSRASKAIILASMVTMLVAGSALAGGAAPTDDQYQGAVEKTAGTYFGFDLAKKHGVTKVKHVSAIVNYNCAGQGEGGRIYARSNSSLKVKNGRFSGKVKLKTVLPSRGSTGSSGTYGVSGKLLKHGKAKGTVDGVVFLDLSGRGGPRIRCYSGRVDWKAKKGAHTFPEG